MRRHILLTVSALIIGACSTEQSSTARVADALADAAATKALPTEHYVSPTEKIDISLPGAWTGHYRVSERKDTTAGARLAIDFTYVPDSSSNAPSVTAFVVRIIPRKTWDWNALVAKGGSTIGAKIGERGNDVFVMLLPGSNPYPVGSPEAPAFDRLIISIARDWQQVRVTPIT